MKELVYLYKNGTTQMVYHFYFTPEILDAAKGPEHWCESENAYIFTVDKFNEDVLKNDIKLF